MKKIKAIVYGVGTIGKLMTKYMVKQGVDIVGAIDINPEITGKDIGELSGLNFPIHVSISDNAESVLSKNEADIVIVSIFSQIERMFPIFKQCIEHGLNVLTPAEEPLYSWVIAPELTSQLDKLAKKHGVTITASGSQDIFRVNMVALLTGGCCNIESVAVKQNANLRKSGPASTSNYFIGETSDEFKRRVNEEGVPLSSLEMCLEAIIAELGLTLISIDQRVEPIFAEEDIEVKSVAGGIVKKGLLSGVSKIIEIQTAQGITFHGEQIGKAFTDEEMARTPVNEISIKGIPEIHVALSLNEIESKSQACAPLTNRIPDVINSEPGYITVEKLDKFKYRAYPLHYYLK